MKIQFVMSDRSTITLDKEKAEAVLTSPENVVMITDDKGQWSGVTINKSYLLLTRVDYDAVEGTITSEDRLLPERPSDPVKMSEAIDGVWARIHASGAKVPVREIGEPTKEG